MNFSTFFSALAVGFFLTTVASAQTSSSTSSPIIIKFSHVVDPDTPKGRAADFFKKIAEERTQGRVRIEVYPNSQLYKDKEEVEALQKGAVQMLAPSLSKFASLGVKAFEVFDIPYIFPSSEVLHEVTEGPIGKNLLRRLESKGIIGLAYWDNGFKIFSANREIKVPSDMKDLRIRIQSSKVIDTSMRILGAIPQQTAFADTYQVLQTNAADGAENPPTNIFTQRIHEVQKYGIITNHGYLGYAVVVNKAFWETLPEDIRKILEQAINDAALFGNENAFQENILSLVRITLSGTIQLYTPSPEELTLWRKALHPVQKEVSDRVGADLIKAINDVSEKHGFMIE